MWEQEVLELIGYSSSMLILVSLVITSAVKHRVVNGIGAVIFTVYAILIRSYPTVILNASLVAVDVWYLVKVLRSKISYTVISAELHESAVNMFLENNREDIEKFFPDWQIQMGKANRAFLSYDGMTMAGILIGREGEPGKLEVLLDYTTAPYRDCSVGKILYPALGKMGIHQLISGVSVAKHLAYLQQMGFVQQGDNFYLDLTKKL